MKLFEDLGELGGTIRDAVQKIIKDVYKQELGDSELDEIVNNLSLSDLLELDRAYTTQDVEKIKGVIGPLSQMEYSMGGGRQATSQASNRPAPTQPQGQQKKVEPGTQNTVQTNRNYSSGAQNAVTTKKLDVNDPNAQMDPTEEEPIKESDDAERLAHHKRNLKDARAELRAAKTASERAHLKQQIQRFEKRIANIENNPIKEEIGPDMGREFYLDLASWVDDWAYENGVEYSNSADDSVNDTADLFSELGIDTKEAAIEWATKQARDNEEMDWASDGPDDFNFEATKEPVSEQTNVVDLVKWLKRRAGIDK
jgi:hypothetical protein